MDEARISMLGLLRVLMVLRILWMLEMLRMLGARELSSRRRLLLALLEVLLPSSHSWKMIKLESTLLGTA